MVQIAVLLIRSVHLAYSMMTSAILVTQDKQKTGKESSLVFRIFISFNIRST